mmetsp:Transcript_31708/g.37292  ORF Transcript_31708/g.37292 Transcript_31708/m.37292 type:complete len:243 (+) Transcript_31708:104-832(+)|eukprot:CAMPEP_0114350736 /NCGR_PEP_ID=MMETSP0101-20121206/16599_1 /TAXON_ID=38822 ORGANISM="Pteridomonas danica, Strain PT" /NCGR_SAMPLE_ID=MMETSP0101 /ASSEMBLY_ACC=CAM_ASM_000211 /LENGTH=242 /DNA_ID=CAMNT_0001490145 /DNA_START=90 /DNA_END=818 /DNA_ORIENTATION=+
MGIAHSKETYLPSENDWPYVWAIRDAEILDWKKSVEGERTAEEIQKLAKAQANLPVEIAPYLYLCGAKHAHDVSLLKEKGITHVLNVAGMAGQGPIEEYKNANIHVLNIDADDEEGYQMLSLHYEKAYNFIESARISGGKCVVHCVAGINRSGVIVASVYMMNEKVNILDTVAHCRIKRGNCFLWNSTFQEELVAMARKEERLGPGPCESGCRVQIVPPPSSSNLFENKTATFNSNKIKSLF